MITRAVFFPFDLFGSPGTKVGAELLADAFQEMLADNEREATKTRARAYAGKVRFEEHAFETLADYQDWRAAGCRAARAAVRKNDFLLWIAGNHLGALPVYDELPADALVLQLDAHLDIYNLSDCTGELSHGNFLMHVKPPLPTIVNIGHRELLLTPEHVEKYYRHDFPGVVATDGILMKVRELAQAAPRVYIDLDCDVFDPAYFPATPGAKPFGLAPAFVLMLLAAIDPKKLGGLFISEFEPARDQHDRCLETLMWLIEYVLLMKYERRLDQ